MMAGTPIDETDKARPINPSKGTRLAEFQTVSIPGFDKPITRSKVWGDHYNKYVSDPQNWWTAQYPKYVVGVLDYYSQYGTVPDASHDAVLRAFAGVPASAGTAGGGGGGASRNDQIRSVTAEITNRAGVLGIKMNPEQIYALATRTVDQNLSTAEVVDAVVAQSDWATNTSGEMTASVDAVRSLGKRYLVSISDDTARDYSRRIASGELTMDGVQSAVMAQARLANPWMQDVIDSGQSPLDVLLPTRDKIAKSLGINASEIDLMDPKYSKMMTVENSDGSVRLANDRELQRNIRSDRQWAKSEEATNVMTGIAQAVAQVFGRSF